MPWAMLSALETVLISEASGISRLGCEANGGSSVVM